jgi:hypothetical protein
VYCAFLVNVNFVFPVNIDLLKSTTNGDLWSNVISYQPEPFWKKISPVVPDNSCGNRLFCLTG